MSNERYKMALERGGAAIKRKSGFLGRVSTRTCSGVQDDLYISLSKSKGGNPAMKVRFRAEVAEAYGITTDDYITVEYDASPDGVLFIVRKATPDVGLKVYRTGNERGVRAAFRLADDDMSNLFSGNRKTYECELKHHDSESGAFVFEEVK